jgi:apolipoprotein N-acyltransferase
MLQVNIRGKRPAIFPASITAAISGVLTGLTVSYILPSVLEWISLAPFVFMLFRYTYAEKERGRRFVRHTLFLGFSYFYPYYLTIFHWFISLYPLEFTGITKGNAAVVVLVSWLGLSLLQATVSMFISPIFVYMLRLRPIAQRSGTSPSLAAPPYFAALYIIFEWLQTLTWASVPWGRLALGQAFSPTLIQTAALFGSYSISFAIAGTGAAIALAAYRFICPNKSTVSKTILRPPPRLSSRFSRSASAAVLALLIFLSNILISSLVFRLREEDTSDRTISVGIIQGNIPSKEKWDYKNYKSHLGICGDLTKQAAAEGADIVLWSETALPYFINSNKELYKSLEELSKESGVIIFVGSFWREDDNNNDTKLEYNAIIQVTPDDGIIKDNIYYKRHLVPFGEYVPLQKFIETVIPPLANLVMTRDPVLPGTNSAVHITPYGKIGSLICFDSIYENLSADSVRDGAEIIAISTNDSWFDGTVALRQHVAQAVLRAIETDRYILRSANTGISCVISPSGDILSATENGERAYFVLDVAPRNTETLYTKTGNIIIIASAAAIIVTLTCSLIFRRRNKAYSPF